MPRHLISDAHEWIKGRGPQVFKVSKFFSFDGFQFFMSLNYLAQVFSLFFFLQFFIFNGKAPHTPWPHTHTHGTT